MKGMRTKRIDHCVLGRINTSRAKSGIIFAVVLLWHHRERDEPRSIRGSGEMIDRLANCGGTGDLSVRYLLPGLVALRAAGHLGDQFQLTCADRSEWTSDDFRSWATGQLERHAGAWPVEASKAVTNSASFQRADITQASDVAAIVSGDEQP